MLSVTKKVILVNLEDNSGLKHWNMKREKGKD